VHREGLTAGVFSELLCFDERNPSDAVSIIPNLEYIIGHIIPLNVRIISHCTIIFHRAVALVENNISHTNIAPPNINFLRRYILHKNRITNLIHELNTICVCYVLRLFQVL
jgi:hypothetical protein